MSGLTDVESLMTVLRDESVDDLHSWRCAYPDRYGPCSCVAELADAVLAWHAAIVARAVNEALTEAADEIDASSIESPDYVSAEDMQRDRHLNYAARIVRARAT